MKAKELDTLNCLLSQYCQEYVSGEDWPRLTALCDEIEDRYVEALTDEERWAKMDQLQYDKEAAEAHAEDAAMARLRGEE